ncbi:MAG TPA: CDP-glucose 4,6-dehydratase [Candidatus Angelobacter sp.]|nr:CDP-glucose 4,6-dehydratase [Candidatus Angelobacter sp.]
MLESHYQGKRVLITGHTGFKGAWLSEWLLMLGAKVRGYALQPPTDPSLFVQLDLANRMEHQIADIRDAEEVAKTVRQFRPDYIFHLAAQSLVRMSYERPLETYAVNVLGTANLLDALRTADWPCSVVVVTSDKCYENKEWVYGYRETDPRGGHDPYSSSKGAAELVVAGYRNSFFQKHSVKIASARAGNVIGGGDWAPDRIVPDCIRALGKNQAIPVRNKTATRPWQHVLEPLSGYLWLAARVFEKGADDPDLCSAFNFGPDSESNRTVKDLVEELLKYWPGRWDDRSNPNAPHEAHLLHLATDKARAILRWAPAWTFADALRETAAWYRKADEAGATAQMQGFTKQQIQAYIAAASVSGISWAAKAQ